MIELAPEDIEISVDNNIDVSTTGDVVVDGVSNELEITFDNNEYSIVGDDMVVLTKYEDAPQWMKDVINGLIDVKTSIAVGDLEATKEALDAMLAELEAAKNTYELSIVSSNDIDQRITTAIETLNSSLQEADATIMNIAQTATTPGEASAIALNTLSASLSADGIIGSTINNLQSAFTDLESTTANSISYLESAMEGEIEGNATAMQTLRTYVGMTEAGASANTGLSAYLVGSNGVAGSADSKVANNVYVDGNGTPRSKFEYNSSLVVNGNTYNSGFGLSNSAGTGIGSEFWINADKFKFTNNGKTGTKVPFSIDASGATPEVYFNGKVTFSNVTNVPQLGSTPQEVVTAINNAQTTTIDGPRITTGSIAAAQINADSALINKLNVTGGIVANNLRVPGVNGGNDLLSASGDRVVISNLKVLGTVSMPGISKGGSFTIPNLTIGSSHPVTVNKPYECTNWSLTAIVTLTNITNNGNPLNFGCTLYINGTNVSSAQSVSPWAINVGTSGTKGSLTNNSVDIMISTSGFGEGSGYFYGTISYIAIVEN